MWRVVSTRFFDQWVDGLKDRRAAAAIFARIARAQEGNLGDVKSVGEGILEMRIHLGPGYRVYLTKHGAEIIFLLCGGDKTTQANDIAHAKKLARNWKG